MRVQVRAIPCEVYSRVVGYYRPVSSWNDGKRMEFEERKSVNVISFLKAKCCVEQRKCEDL
ncbi:MAG: anaerobic ribonucleoside-triphosphate reductase [Desulfurococcaceae archaeon]